MTSWYENNLKIKVTSKPKKDKDHLKNENNLKNEDDLKKWRQPQK